MAYSRSLADLLASLLANLRQVVRLAISTGALTYLLWWMRSPELSHASASPVADKINQFGCFNRAGLALYVVPAISGVTRKRAVWMPSSLFSKGSSRRTGTHGASPSTRCSVRGQSSFGPTLLDHQCVYSSRRHRPLGGSASALWGSLLRFPHGGILLAPGRSRGACSSLLS